MLAPIKSSYIPAGTLAPSSRKTMDATLYDALFGMGLRATNRSTLTANTTLDITNTGLCLVDATSGNITLTLPASGATADDMLFRFRRIDDTVNTVTIARSGSDTIEGLTSVGLAGNASLSMQIPAGSTQWRIWGIGASSVAALRGLLGVDGPTLIPSLPGSNVLRMTLKTNTGQTPSVGGPVMIPFRNATLATATMTVRQVTSAITLDVASTATLGGSNGIPHQKFWYLLDNAGTVELAVSGANFGRNFIGSTTAMAAASNDPGTIYSTTSRSNVPMKLIAITWDTQTTAGTYAAVPTEVRYPDAADEHFDRSASSMLTGRYFNPCLVGATTNGGVTPGASLTYYIPYRQLETRSMAAFSVWVSTLGAGNIRLGIYSDASGLPGALIATVGTASSGTTGAKDISFGKVLPAGRYWLALQCDNGTAVVTGYQNYIGGNIPLSNDGIGWDFSGVSFNAADARRYYTQAQAYSSGLAAAASGLTGWNMVGGSIYAPVILGKA